MSKNELVSQEWYDALIEDCKAIITECEFTARWALVEGYHALGKRILEENDNFERAKIYGEEIVSRVTQSLGKSKRTIWRALQFAQKYPELEVAPFGKNVSWHMVCNKYLPAPKESTAEIELPRDITERYRLICGDAAAVDPGPIDTIITDPPYSREFVYLYGVLARMAKEKLPRGGSLLAMAGQSFLPEVLLQMTPHLDYQWTLAYQLPGASLQVFQRQVLNGWKPVLWFVNGKYEGDWAYDVVRSEAPDKKYHTWGQSETGMAQLIERFSKPGDTIYDPFLGGGTTALVALKMNRHFIGTDVDPQCIETTEQRIKEWYAKKSQDSGH